MPLVVRPVADAGLTRFASAFSVASEATGMGWTAAIGIEREKRTTSSRARNRTMTGRPSPYQAVSTTPSTTS
ncbi:hypothetical protein ACOCJ7_18065 [Knoellia sp. CPCC 206453]|uniref:hypothetical protein n=1 Tax=Knoellia pratensis TaxID=3404796 RepID=UPI00360D59FC